SSPASDRLSSACAAVFPVRKFSIPFRIKPRDPVGKRVTSPAHSPPQPPRAIRNRPQTSTDVAAECPALRCLPDTLQSASYRGRPQPAAQHSPTTAQARSLAVTPLHGTHPAPTAAECAAPRPAPAPRHAPVLFASPRQQRTPEPSFG